MPERTDRLLADIERHREDWLHQATLTREMVLSNLAMISEVPGQTFHEQDRAALILDRFIATSLPEPQSDKMHNVMAIIRGNQPERRILVFANMDHQFAAGLDQNVTITQDRAFGTGVADDSIALATLVTLPDIISRIGLRFDSDIVLLATTRAHGRGDFGGIRFFLDNFPEKIDYAVYLEGVPLGKVNYFSLSRVRCDIVCEIDAPSGSPWGRITNTSAILVLNEIMNRLYSIPLPRQPKTIVNVGMVSGGERYSTVSTQASARIEVLSEDDAVMGRLIEEIHDRCIDVGAKYGVEISSEFFGRHHAAGLSYSHPLVKSAVAIVNQLGYAPVIEYSNNEMAVPLALSIPSVNLGVTTGSTGAASREYVDLPPIPRGILQIVLLLHAIDRGYCHD